MALSLLTTAALFSLAAAPGDGISRLGAQVAQQAGEQGLLATH